MAPIHPVKELLNAKSLGFYNCCEVTTVFLYQIKERRIYHFYTIFVAEERISYNAKEEAMYLTPQRLNVSENVSLGIRRIIVPLSRIEWYYDTLNNAIGNSSVNIGDGELVIGKIEAVPKFWVSQDSTVEFKLNRIIKNNFKNGSYLLEFFDTEKCVRNILTEGELQRACEMLYAYVPIDLFTLSDRIGNFIFQFPSLNVNISYRSDEQEKKLFYQIDMDKRLAGTKGYRLISEIVTDDAILGFGTQEIVPPNTECTLDVGDASKLCRTTLLDSEQQLILSHRETTFIKRFNGRIHIGSQFGKERELYGSDGTIIKTIDVLSGSPITTGKEKGYNRDEVIELRKYNLRMEDVKRRCEFLRYGIKKDEGRDKAIDDIIELMNRGDGHRVYLWDPYLSAQDILDTWYCTKFCGVELKAITSRADCNRECGDTGHSSMKEWISQQAVLLQNGSNHYGIKMEFRCQWKGHGYAFHDRFLMIVDEKEKPLVWSLGASINSVGSKHHIIQKVLHPQMIVDAFEELWDMLSDEECLVWKTPN